MTPFDISTSLQAILCPLFTLLCMNAAILIAIIAIKIKMGIDLLSKHCLERDENSSRSERFLWN